MTPPCCGGESRTGRGQERQGGDKPRPYYGTAWQANAASKGETMVSACSIIFHCLCHWPAESFKGRYFAEALEGGIGRVGAGSWALVAARGWGYGSGVAESQEAST